MPMTPVCQYHSPVHGRAAVLEREIVANSARANTNLATLAGARFEERPGPRGPRGVA
jgi:hypothetical protein